MKSCVGSTWCRYGVQDSVGLAIELELRYRGLRSPHKLKLGVSGCARECAEARGKDVGVIATENGWNLYVGGNGGFTPAARRSCSPRTSTPRRWSATIDRFLMYYVRTADRLQRTAPWVEELEGGLDAHPRGGRRGLASASAPSSRPRWPRHVDGYEDEWAATLDDPEKLRRFVSFVNAPDTARPVARLRRASAARPDPPRTRSAPARAVLIAGTTLEVRR